MTIGHQVTDSSAITKNEAKVLCQNIFATSNELISLLEEETSLLRKAKTKHISPLKCTQRSIDGSIVAPDGKIQTTC